METEEQLLKAIQSGDRQAMRRLYERYKGYAMSIGLRYIPDSDDVVFYDVARAHQDKGAYLVTGNLKHFPNCGFAVSPRDFMNVITLNKGVLMLNDNTIAYNLTPTKQDGLNLLAALHEAQRQAHENGVDNLTEEEIEAEIKAARAERKKRLGTNG